MNGESCGNTQGKQFDITVLYLFILSLVSFSEDFTGSHGEISGVYLQQSATDEQDVSGTSSYRRSLESFADSML